MIISHLVEWLNIDVAEDAEGGKEEEVQWDFVPDAELSDDVERSTSIYIDAFDIGEDDAPSESW